VSRQRGTRTRVVHESSGSVCKGAGTREWGETRCVKVGTSDLGETSVEGSKAGEWGGLSYSR